MPFSLRRQLNRLVTPRSATEDSRRQELILNILLVGTWTLALLSVLFVVVQGAALGADGGPYLASRLPASLVPFIIFISLYGLSRIGWYRLSSYIFISLYFALGCYSVITWGLIIPQGTFLFVLAIIMASILVGTRFALIVTIATTAFALSYKSLVINGTFDPDISWRLIPETEVQLVFYSANLFLITLVSWLSNREIERSLARARRSEAALKKERDLLEVKVEERTREFEQLQMEKLSQLYRFAEAGKAATGILHDIANPLNAVTATLDQLQDPAESKLLKRAREGAKRMEDYLAEARKQIKNQKESTAFPVNRQIVQAIRSLEARSKETGVPVKFDRSQDTYLFGSQIRFQQMVINVISNALDAYEGRKKEPVTVKVVRDGENVIITVTDAGIGIAKEHLKAIFEPLFTTKGDKGTGLGLSICKEIIEVDFGGTIAVKSEEGVGTAFTIVIPENGKPGQD